MDHTHLKLIDDQIAACENSAKRADEDAMYADRASDDRRRASEWRTKAAQWREIKAVVEAAQ
ncbi:hypothetical protein D3C76_1141160 [compost metagenome]